MTAAADLERHIEQLSPADFQETMASWRAQRLTNEQARRAEGFARDVVTRYPYTLDETELQVIGPWPSPWR